MTLNSPPVREKNIAKPTSVTSRKPGWTVIRRTCARNEGRAPDLPLGPPVAVRSSLVSGTRSQASSAAPPPITAYAQNGAARPNCSASTPPGQRPEPDREREDAAVGRHDPPAPLGRADVGQHDLAGGQDEAGPEAGDEARGQERRVRGGERRRGCCRRR